MSDCQKSATQIISKREPTIFVLTMCFIEDRERKCIEKDCGSLVESHPMFTDIGDCFGRIPLKVINSLAAHGYKTVLRPRRSAQHRYIAAARRFAAASFTALRISG
jgi:hypothetical protein